LFKTCENFASAYCFGKSLDGIFLKRRRRAQHVKREPAVGNSATVAYASLSKLSYDGGAALTSRVERAPLKPHVVFTTILPETNAESDSEPGTVMKYSAP